MNIDRLARHTHRRGFLAAVAALAIPATARTAGAQFAQCSRYGGGCTLTIHCCGHTTCYVEPLNPNSGVAVSPTAARPAPRKRRINAVS